MESDWMLGLYLAWKGQNVLHLFLFLSVPYLFSSSQSPGLSPLLPEQLDDGMKLGPISSSIASRKQTQ